jgi:hypothetical protein
MLTYSMEFPLAREARQYRLFAVWFLFHAVYSLNVFLRRTARISKRAPRKFCSRTRKSEAPAPVNEGSNVAHSAGQKNCEIRLFGPHLLIFQNVELRHLLGIMPWNGL